MITQHDAMQLLVRIQCAQTAIIYAHVKRFSQLSCAMFVLPESVYYAVILDKYQEQPHLLDPYLGNTELTA